MKKNLVLSAALSLFAAISTQAANIAWVSYHAADNTPTAAAVTAGFTRAPDVGYTDLLTANGHTVTRFGTVDNIQNLPDIVAALNTNDLVIISRSVPSGHYQDLAETAVWNTLTPPVITVNGYINRANRLGFHTGDTIPDSNSSQMRLRVSATAHPIFAGVALDATGLMVNPYSQRVTFTNAAGTATLQAGISVVTSPLIAGGSILAAVGTAGDAALNGMIIGEFPAGITSQRGDVFASKRLVFLTGSRESGITSEGSGIFDLFPDGQTLLLNAITYLLSSQPPKCTVPLISATNLLPGDAWTFSAGPIGDPPLTFQWYKNDQPITDATLPTLNFTSLTTADAGNYHLVIANAVSSATSTVGTLTFAVAAPASITNSLISYWPLDAVLGTKTPDLVSGYDMTLTKMGAANVTAGKWGNAFRFDNTAQTLLQRVNNAGDALPIYQFPDFTVSLWVNGPVQSDHRVFSEGSLTNGNPLFNLGTHNTGADGTVDLYIRNNTGGTVGDHRHSVGIAFDDTWHNIVYVQREVGNGIMKAQLWVDGILDSVVITPVRPLTPSTTTIGGILRASASAWFTGLIDEVAVWNRALSEQEIGILQTTFITNPPSRLQPLAINRFRADLPAVVTGGSTTLRWDVSKDATQVTVDTLGDVTSQTAVGIGSRAITPAQSATYVLTVRRGTDMLSATTSVAVVEGVASNWNLLDNFDQYPEGNLFSNGYWNDTAGNSASVLSVNGNRAIRTSAAGIAYLNLRDLTVTENQARTLFFRMIAGPDNAVGATNLVGLTDKSQRSYADAFANIGPVLYATAFTNDIILATTNAWYLGARNNWLGGNVSNPIDLPGPALDSGVVYNVWIDITNAPSTDLFLSDTFTVFVQKEGDTGRSVLFQDYVSDRDLYYVDAVLGGMLPNLDKLVVMGNSNASSAVFDDFYLSTGGINATLPKAYATPPPGPLSIVWQGAQLEIRWTNGKLQSAASVTGPWSDVSGNPASPLLVNPAGSASFYRARQ